MKKIFFFAAALMASVSMFAANISCADAKAKIDANDKNEYTVVGYVTKIVDDANPVYKNITFWMADTKGENQEFEVYRLSFKDKAAADIPVAGDKVAVTATLKKYSPKTGDPVYETDKISSYEIREKGNGVRYTDDDLVISDVNVAGAKEILDELLPTGAAGDEVVTKKFYRVSGYNTGIKEAWTDQYKNESFYMSDEVGVNMGFQAYRASTKSAIEEGAYVAVTGQLRKNFYESSGKLKSGYEIENGTAEVIPEPQAINNVNAEAVKAMKVIENGQLFIIRNGVKYNAAGAVVK